MTSQEARGSFMLMSDVAAYFINTFTEDEQKIWLILTNLADQSALIDETWYISTDSVQSKMSAAHFRTMECKVVTHVFGLEPLRDDIPFLDCRLSPENPAFKSISIEDYLDNEFERLMDEENN